MSEIREVTCEATVRIIVSINAPADWLSRVADDDFPYRLVNGGPLMESDGLEMLAYNALRNGVDDASRLDGWADLDRGMVQLQVTDVEAIT